MFSIRSFEIRNLFLVFVLLQQFVCIVNSSCVGKYQITSNGNNFNFHPRNMSDLVCERFSRDPLRATMENNGQTILIRYIYQNKIPVIAAGPLGDDQYRFEFMHFNWLNEESLADNDDETVAPVTLPVELHLIFSNTRFGNFRRAATKNLGIAIMSFKHTVSELKYSKRLYEALENIRNPNEKTELGNLEAPALFSVIYPSTFYYAYLGKSAITQSMSETCGPDVIWLDYPKPIEITSAHFQNIRDLMSFNGVPLMNQTDLSMSPNTTVYTSIDHYEYRDNGWTAETFEGFGVVADSTAEWRNQKLFIVIIVVQIAIRWFNWN